MQQNSADTFTKLTSSAENQSTNSVQFPRARNYDRFVVTPETMGMNLRLNTTASTSYQQSPLDMPSDDVKAFYEHHIKASSMSAICKNESKVYNTSTSPYSSIRPENMEQHNRNPEAEFIAQGHSPNISPILSSHQWNFEPTMINEFSDLNLQYTPYNNNGIRQTISDPCPTTHGKFLSEDPIIYNEQEIQKYRSGSDVCADISAKLNLKTINELYKERIMEIDTKAWGDKDLKIYTYKEWVNILIRISESFTNNLEDLEREVAERLELVQKRVTSNCRHSQGNELMKCRKDIDTLVKYIRNAHYNKKCDLRDLTLETISLEQILGISEFQALTTEENDGDEIKTYNESDIIGKNKLYANMKALAHEVAEKHDEVRELKRQVICLEDEIQKAQKKIQLKDDVIKELRNDLKAANNKICSNSSQDTSLVMSPTNYEEQTPRSDNGDNSFPFQVDTDLQIDFLRHSEQIELQAIKLLREEFSDLVEKSHEKKQILEKQFEIIKGVIKNKETEKAAVCHKLDYIRCQLNDLEADYSAESTKDYDSGFHSKEENNQDVKLLESVRKRLRKLNEMNSELKKEIQKLELENSELKSNMETEKYFYQRNSEVLKQVADLLCDMRSKHFSYSNLYNANSSQMNPFCEAIEEMHKNFEEKESQLMEAIRTRNKEIEELSDLLMKSEKEFNEDKTLKNFEDIDNTPATLLSTTSQPQPVTTANITGAPKALSTLFTSLSGNN